MYSFHSRLWLIDLLKTVAAQFIVLHHLAWFGPLSINAAALAPAVADTIAWLANYGRYAVAVFFVTGGFLAAQGLTPSGLNSGDSPLCLIRERYFRLVFPFMAALLLSIACNFVARPWLPPDLAGQSAGDFAVSCPCINVAGRAGYRIAFGGCLVCGDRFPAVCAVCPVALGLGQRMLRRRPANTDFYGVVPVLLVALASLFYFNRDERWDDTAFYFFGAYALGHRQRLGRANGKINTHALADCRGRPVGAAV